MPNGITPAPLEIFPHLGRTSDRFFTKGWRRYLRALFPLHLLKPLKMEAQMAWLRLRTRKSEKLFRNRTGMMVNLGCGDHGKPGWVNIDAYKAPGLTLAYDCRRKLPLPDESVRGIFTEHFFEHIDYTEEVPYFLSECRRVLAPRGVLRIVVPDASMFLRAYLADGWEEMARIRQLTPDRRDPFTHSRLSTKMEMVNLVFRQGHEHKFGYDYETLEFLLKRYGFAKVAQSEFGRSWLPGLALDQELRRSESLYVEAMKG